MAIVLSWTAAAQEFSIKKIEVTAEQVIVHYDLIDTTRFRTYTIRVYSSSDKFLTPLKNVSGDVGFEVAPGTFKKIIWNSKSELGMSFIGGVELEVRGRVYIPFIRLSGFEDTKYRKRKEPFIVKWTGGTAQNILNFQLYNKDHKLVHTFPNAPNEHQYRLTIPTSVKPGKGYYFRISDSKNADQIIASPSFAVKPKYSMAIKSVPVIAVAGGLYFLISSLSGKNDDLDTPPSLPSDHN